MLALGLMSGTSLDGVDAALIETDGEEKVRPGPAATFPFPEDLRQRLRAVLGGAGDVAGAERALTLFHADIVGRILADTGAQPALIGFHGQTILHRPEQRRTWQIGDGALLARQTGINVINDFRSADVAAGGQGAPLVPVYHRALAAGLERPLAVLNLGGVGNVTWIGLGGALIAFDTGPGNALIDDWVLERSGNAYDQDGRLAASGSVHEDRLAILLSPPYFDRAPPKSLDRDEFRHAARAAVEGLSPADGAATLTAFTVRAVGLACSHFSAPPRRWVVGGGGRLNRTIMAGLARELTAPVQPVEAVGWDGDALEAQAFAYLAVRSRLGLPLTFPGTTGAPCPLTAGTLSQP